MSSKLKSLICGIYFEMLTKISLHYFPLPCPDNLSHIPSQIFFYTFFTLPLCNQCLQQPQFVSPTKNSKYMTSDCTVFWALLFSFGILYVRLICVFNSLLFSCRGLFHYVNIPSLKYSFPDEYLGSSMFLAIINKVAKKMYVQFYAYK